MKIVINNKSKFRREFVYNSLPKYIRRLVIEDLDQKKMKIIDEQLGIKTVEVIKFAIEHLKVTEDEQSYIIEVNRNITWKNKNLSLLINLITYGNRSVKGYNILYKTFKYICDNIDKLYDRWLGGRL